MQYMTNTGNTKTSNLFLTTIWLGLLTGTLDAIGAMIWSGKIGPLFKYIASGVFGKAAFTGGHPMVFWGIFFHYLIAYCCTAVLFLAYPMFKSAFKNKYVIGIVFAVLAWLVTNLAIVPLSAIGWRPMHLNNILISFGILIFTIGLPTALIADKIRK
jgi:hypothetical protein